MIAEGALRIGQSVTKQVALRWFADKKADSRRGWDLAKLVRARFPFVRKEREILDSLRTIEDDVARGLEPDLARASYGLPENERDAALMAVSDALEDADISDSVLFGADLDAKSLAAEVRRQQPVDRAGLSERAVRLYDAALERACVVLVHLVGELPEFDAAIAVESLRRLSSALEGIDALLERVPAVDLSAPSGRHLDDEFLRRYCDLVARAYDRLEVIGLTTYSYEPRTTLSVAYLSLSVTGDSDRTDKEVVWHAMERSVSDNVRVEVALGDSRLTVVRGEAGAGKSTLLRWLAVNAARSAFTGKLGEWNGCVPFLVKLRDFAVLPLPHGDALLDQPSSPPSGPVPQGWAHRQFESGKALLLVDGVDELVTSRRSAVRDWLRQLLVAYPDLRVVVTSRPTAVTSKWLLNDGFGAVVVEPMSPDDVQVFLQRWHTALLAATDPAALPCAPAEVDQHRRTLLAQLHARPHLRALARSPLLCAMLCALNLDRRSKLPRDRVALYSAALDMLLERRDADRSVGAGAAISLSAGEKLVLLQVLAWWLNENGRTEMSRKQALARMADRLQGMPNVTQDAEVLLEHLIERSGVIRQSVQGRVDFIHRTFQEFLAAREAVDRDSVDLLVREATSDQWRETVVMACAQGSPEQRGRLLNGILDAAERATGKTSRHLSLLAASCKETAVLAPPAVLKRIDERVQTIVPSRSVRESRSLATVGEPVLDYLPADLAELSPAKAAACVRTAALVNGPRAIEVLRAYARDPRWQVTYELSRAWRYFDPETFARRVLSDAPLTVDGRLGYFSVEGPAVPFLHLLDNLRNCRIDLWGLGGIVKEVVSISRLHKLRSLVVLGDLYPESLSRLARLSELMDLFLNFDEGWPSAMPFIAELPGLRSLSLVNSDSLQDFTFLRGLPNLHSISLFSNPVDAWMGEVAAPDRLTHVVCSADLDRPVQQRFVAQFPNARGMTFIGAKNTTTMRDIRSLARLPLERVAFSGCSGVDLSGLRSCRTLRSISISSVDAVDLSVLQGMSLSVYLGRDVRAIGDPGPGVRVASR